MDPPFRVASFCCYIVTKSALVHIMALGQNKLSLNYYKRRIIMFDMELIESLRRYVGRTVTIFTTSGGLSGAGFTGVLASVCDGTVRLITCIGAPPCCPVGSACGTPNTCNSWGSWGGGWDWGSSWGSSWGGGGWNSGWGMGSNWLGSVTEIPISRIASFVHNTI